MFRNNVKIIILLILGCALAIPALLCARVLQFNAVTIATRVTSHPDSYNTNANLTVGSPIVADLDGDFVLEIICAGYNEDEDTTSVYVWERNGSLRDGWPVEVSGEVVTELAVGDLDGDGLLEITLGVDTYLYAWTAEGDEADDYPEFAGFTLNNIVVGDIADGFEDEIVYLEGYQLALADLDSDGKQEIAGAGSAGLIILDGDETELASEMLSLTAAGNPVVYDNQIFFAGTDGSDNYLYGYSYAEESITVLSGFPVALTEIENTDDTYLSLADLDGDDVPEVITGSANGRLAAYDLTGTEVFNIAPEEETVYQPVVADADNDGDMEIISSSGSGALYCYDASGTAVELADWPDPYSFSLAPGLVLVDIDQDATGDEINPAGDLELLFSSHGRVYSIDLPGDFEPADIQWGMYGFNNRGSGSWLADYTTDSWSIFDNDPDEAEISIVYDWNRGSRVIELDGAGLNNCYAFMDTDGTYLNTTNTQLQWSMRYHLDFAIYVSVDTTEG